MEIHSNSAWSRQRILDYLDHTTTPIRVSCNDRDGYPLVCSLWFVHDQGVLWAACHKSAYILKALRNSPKIGFEVATNDFPYKGVRGKADVEILPDSDVNALEQVIEKYLGDSNEKLATWLMSRKADEFAMKISPTKINAWDYTQRMERSTD